MNSGNLFTAQLLQLMLITANAGKSPEDYIYFLHWKKRSTYEDRCVSQLDLILYQNTSLYLMIYTCFQCQLRKETNAVDGSSLKACVQIPWTYLKVERENQVHKVILWFLHANHGILSPPLFPPPHSHTGTHNQTIKIIKNKY